MTLDKYIADINLIQKEHLDDYLRNSWLKLIIMVDLIGPIEFQFDQIYSKYGVM